MLSRTTLLLLVASLVPHLSGGPQGSVPAAALPPVSAGPEVRLEADADSPGLAQAIGRALHTHNPYLTTAQRERAARAVVRSSGRYGLDPELVTAVILVESSARPWALSPKGAMGLMQVMPYMARSMDVAGNYTTIETNIELGCRILADNIERLGLEDGVSAYFWGSEIRGTSYLRKIQAAQAEVRRLVRS